MGSGNAYETFTDEETTPVKDSEYKKKQRGCTTTERQLVVVIIACLIIIFVMAALLVVHFFVRLKVKNCETPECVEVAGSLLAKMNLTQDPCTDFYTYSCGGWIAKVVRPPEKPKFSAFAQLATENKARLKTLLEQPGYELAGHNSTAVKKVKAFYHACMNSSDTEKRGIIPALEAIKYVGSWTFTNDSISGIWDEGSWDMMATLIKTNLFGSTSLFSMGVSADDKKSTENIITFDQGGLSFSDRKFYLGSRNQTYHSALVTYIHRVAELLGGKSDLKQKAEDIWDFETRIAEIHAAQEDRQDQTKLYHKMTVLELHTDVFGDWFNLPAFLKGLFGVEIPSEELVLVYAPEYIKKLGAIVKSTKPETLVNYLVWQMVGSFVPYLPMSFLEVNLELQRTLYGVNSLQPLWDRCVERSTHVVPLAIGALYVQNQFGQKQKNDVLNILGYIKDEFHTRLPEVEWMDEPTMHKAQEKVVAILNKIGYSDLIGNITALDEKYALLNVTPDNAFDNMLHYVSFYSNKILKKRGKPVDKTEWDMPANEVNAYYSATKNEIVFPAGILQRPFYDPVYAMALNFGAIGMVMGHELTHGFDNTGRLFDKNGNMHNWWTPESTSQFKNKTQCLINQYNGYKVGDSNINGIITLGENIADNGGLKTAYYAYQSWLKKHDNHELRAALPGLNLTGNQLFFLGFSQIWCTFATPEYMRQALITDVHTAAKYRVIGSLSNMKEFAEAYSCPANSTMNPDNKCVVW